MEIAKRAQGVLRLLLKDFTATHSVTSLSADLGVSRQGMFKILKKLERENLVILSPVGSGKTSTYTISLNRDNPLVEKMLAVILAEEALKNQRWARVFSEFEGKADFCIIYGSILDNPREASDIDIASVISKKKNFVELDKITTRMQKTQLKKIHALNFTEAEFKSELKKPNKAFVDAVKKGVVLFGQENFIKFIRGIAE